MLGSLCLEVKLVFSSVNFILSSKTHCDFFYFDAQTELNAFWWFSRLHSLMCAPHQCTRTTLSTTANRKKHSENFISRSHSSALKWRRAHFIATKQINLLLMASARRAVFRCHNIFEPLLQLSRLIYAAVLSRVCCRYVIKTTSSSSTHIINLKREWRCCFSLSHDDLMTTFI